MARLEKREDSTELFIDGIFIASWRKIDVNEKDLQLICNMIETGVEHGERKKAAEVRAVLGVR